MRTVILNSTNIQSGTNNTTLIYNFPGGGVNFKNDEISIGQVTMFYSWFNINSSPYNNNVYRYYWIGNPFTINMPDGNYNVVELNSYLQNTMIANTHYLIDASGQNVYYAEWVLNPTYYSVQLVCYPIPTVLPAGWTAPPGFVFPGVTQTPQIEILATNNFGLVVGFLPGIYPSPVQATVYNKLSDFTPEVSKVNSIIVECNLINNEYSVPSKLLYSFAIPDVLFGTSFSVQPSELIFNDIQDGFYNQIILTLKDQNLNKINIKDPQMVFLLTIRKKQDLTPKLLNLLK